MRKFKLDLDTLVVESFALGGSGGVGTVRARDSMVTGSLCGQDGSESAYNCAPTCGSCAGIQTCQDTCDGLAKTCANVTCYDTCPCVDTIRCHTLWQCPSGFSICAAVTDANRVCC